MPLLTPLTLVVNPTLQALEICPIQLSDSATQPEFRFSLPTPPTLHTRVFVDTFYTSIHANLCGSVWMSAATIQINSATNGYFHYWLICRIFLKRFHIEAIKILKNCILVIKPSIKSLLNKYGESSSVCSYSQLYKVLFYSSPKSVRDLATWFGTELHSVIAL